MPASFVGTGIEFSLYSKVCHVVVFILFLEAEVSYKACSCTALTHEVLRMLTDESKVLLVQAAKFGLVFVMLFELQCLTGNRKYTEVSVLCMYFSSQGFIN